MATKKETIKTVDIAPEYSINGDFRKISEYDFAAYNSKILPVITLLLMEEGANQLYPRMGLRGKLMEIPYSTRTELDGIISKVSEQLTTYTNSTISIHVNEEKSDWIIGDIYLAIDIEGVPGTLNFGVSKDAAGGMQPFKISHPSIFNK